MAESETVNSLETRDPTLPQESAAGLVHIASTRALGSVIRQRRKALGLRQDAVAMAAGVGVMFVSSIERGKPSAEIERVLAVLNAVGIDVFVKPRA
jgi:y4mF family transcriptional regulator